MTEPFFSGKVIFAQIWAKRDQNGPKIEFFGFFEKFYHYYQFVCAKPVMSKVFKIRSFHISTISPENHEGWGWIFCLEIKTKVSYKLIISLCVGIASHAQSAQNKFAISSQYFKENVKDKVDFLPGDKHQRFLQIVIVILGVCGQTCTNYENNNFAISLKYLMKKVSHEVDFLHAEDFAWSWFFACRFFAWSFLQIDSMIFMGMVKHSQSSKIAILQCL